MIEKEYVILAPEGMHARPATALIRIIKKYKSMVSMRKDGQLIRLNSMLNILSMAAKGGETLVVVIEGEDEPEAALAIDSFFMEQLSNF
jgi:phosphocarrier protein HPr